MQFPLLADPIRYQRMWRDYIQCTRKAKCKINVDHHRSSQALNQPDAAAAHLRLVASLFVDDNVHCVWYGRQIGVMAELDL